MSSRYGPDELSLTLEEYCQSYPDWFRAEVEATFGSVDAKESGLVVCPVCHGKGKYVNPAIDSQGLTAEDFAEDPDFAEDYFRGTYDKRCECCEGNNVVNQLQYAKYLARLTDYKEEMAERGERYGDSRL